VARFISDAVVGGSGTDNLFTPTGANTVSREFLPFMVRYRHVDGSTTEIFGLGLAGGGSSGATLVNGWIHRPADGTTDFSISEFEISPASIFFGALDASDPTALRTLLFSGADEIIGGAAANLLSGLSGDDTITGRAGNDTIDGGEGTGYLRGDEGDDQIVGGSGFDDINGNMGNDTASGGLGEDWVVGGKDNDSLSGGAAFDLVYGNLGNDTLDGGEGADIVRGGQQDDVLSGGAGDDYVSGDRDNDTVTGGSGADIFHSFGDAGLDLVTDFNRAEGDRVLLDAGATYTVAQVGADTVVSLGGGAQMVLAGVSMGSLTGDWIGVG